jgi:hypothetical protein
MREWNGSGTRSFPPAAHPTHAVGGGTIRPRRGAETSVSVGRGREFGVVEAGKNASEISSRAVCDKASPVAVVMLHLRFCYVSKAAILTVLVCPHRSKIEVPLEFQGLGSLGAASWRRFFPCEFDS